MIFLLLTLLIVPTQIVCKDKYQPFHMAADDLSAVLHSSNQFATPSLAHKQADVCFGCADVKYDHGAFKIVEGGDGIYMSLRAADFIINNKAYNLVAPFWGVLWHFLHQFNLPVWLVEGISNNNAMAISESKKLGIRFARSFEALEHDPAFQEAIATHAKNPEALNDHAGIIVFSASQEKNREGIAYKSFRKQYPQCIFLNGTARDYLKRKDTLYQLFQRAKLDSFIPAFEVFSTEYDPATVQRIKALLSNTDLIVIKPTYSSLSCGVNIIEERKLASFLKLILQTPKEIPSSAKRGLGFWRHNKQSHFVASEYVPSQTIYKDDRPYDPTMRVMFIMYHDQGIVHVNVLGGFWKIPVKPLNDRSASQTAKHVTIAHAGDYFSGILLEQEESLRMKQVMAPVLAKAYEQMLLERS